MFVAAFAMCRFQVVEVRPRRRVGRVEARCGDSGGSSSVDLVDRDGHRGADHVAHCRATVEVSVSAAIISVVADGAAASPAELAISEFHVGRGRRRHRRTTVVVATSDTHCQRRRRFARLGAIGSDGRCPANAEGEASCTVAVAGAGTKSSKSAPAVVLSYSVDEQPQCHLRRQKERQHVVLVRRR